MLTDLYKTQVFSMLDLFSSHSFVCVSEKSQSLTAFSTRLWTFKYRVVPFKVCNATANFQEFSHFCIFWHSKGVCDRLS
jgi:hypothetical protein